MKKEIENAAKAAEKQQKRVVGKPFKKGQSGNPSGMKKGTIDFMTQLKNEIKEVEKEKGISLIKFAVQKAYSNPQVLIAMLKKIIPDINQSEIKIESAYEEYEKMSDEELIDSIKQRVTRLGSFLSNTDIN